MEQQDYRFGTCAYPGAKQFGSWLGHTTQMRPYCQQPGSLLSGPGACGTISPSPTLYLGHLLTHPRAERSGDYLSYLLLALPILAVLPFANWRMLGASLLPGIPNLAALVVFPWSCPCDASLPDALGCFSYAYLLASIMRYVWRRYNNW